MADERPVTVRITPGLGRSEVILDGQDVSALLYRVSIDLTARQLPQVYLELGANVLPEAIECESVVHVIREIKEDPAVAMLRFLENIDPGELDRCILESTSGLGEPQTYGVICLDILRQWASGE